VTVLQRLIAINSNPALYHREIGYSYWQLGNVDQAVSSLNKAISLSNEESVSHYYLGLIYVGKKDRDSAMRSYRELVRLKYASAQLLLDRINAIK
jgi:tetratricopeptide (TPR) repeat protein